MKKQIFLGTNLFSEIGPNRLKLINEIQITQSSMHCLQHCKYKLIMGLFLEWPNQHKKRMKTLEKSSYKLL